MAGSQPGGDDPGSIAGRLGEGFRVVMVWFYGPPQGGFFGWEERPEVLPVFAKKQNVVL